MGYKEKVFKKWVDSGYKQPATQEELDIVIELQSNGYSPKNAELEQSRKKWQQYYDKNRSAPFPKSMFDDQLNQETKPKGVNEVKKLSKLLEDY